MSKIRLAAFFFVLGITAILLQSWMQQALLIQGFSWVLTYFFPWFLVLLFSFLAALQMFGLLKSHVRFWLPIVSFLVLPSLFFAMNPIYEGDFNKSGKPKDWIENQILMDVMNLDSNFEGLVCVASPSCPFCVEAVQTKIYHVYKRGKVDALVYLGRGDTDVANQFRVNADAPEIPIVLNSAPDDGLDIDEKVIPVFLYIRDGKIIHLWRNEQLGFPALDWIESGLH